MTVKGNANVEPALLHDWLTGQGVGEVLIGRALHVLGRAAGDTSKLELRTRRGADARERRQILDRWYRERLRELIPPLLEKWESILGVHVSAWGIRRMKTKWGSCTVEARRIWVNLELAKKPPQCLEYLIVHELAHLIERHHNDRFISLMNRNLPSWQLHRDELNAAPLAHADWTC